MSIAVYSAQQTQQLFALFSAMTDYYAGDPARINHFVKVHAYARQIGLAEQLDADALFLLETAALTHDIGIREAERLYGQCGGKLQERLGPPEAQKMLDSLGFAPDVTERVCFLIAHHHTLDGVDAPVRMDVVLTKDQVGSFVYGADEVAKLVLPDWSLIAEHQADWINSWNAIFSVK